MIWDAYFCTYEGDVQEITAELTRLFYLAEMQPVRGRTYGYERIVGWFHGPEELARMYHGGNGGRCSVQSKGQASIDVARRMRYVFPDHSVSRADVRQDWHYQGAWEEITAMALRIAQEHGLRLTEIKGHGHGDTLYLGSRSSVSHVRIYQKAKEMMGPDADPDHVRVELELKPGNGMAKRMLARMKPEECFGSSEWTRELATALWGIPPEKVKLGTVYRAPEILRTRRWLVSQGLQALEHWAEDVGGWAALGRAMHELKAEQEAIKEAAQVRRAAAPIGVGARSQSEGV